MFGYTGSLEANLIWQGAPVPHTQVISCCETHMQPSAPARSWVEAFNRADAEALAGLYAEDAVNHQVANEPVLGRAAIHRMFAEEFAKAGMRVFSSAG